MNKCIYRFCFVCTILNSILTVLVYLFSGGLLVCVKGNGASFAAEYSQELCAFCSCVCVNCNSSTKLRVRRYNVTFFKTVLQEFSL